MEGPAESDLPKKVKVHLYSCTGGLQKGGAEIPLPVYSGNASLSAGQYLNRLSLTPAATPGAGGGGDGAKGSCRRSAILMKMVG